MRIQRKIIQTWIPSAVLLFITSVQFKKNSANNGRFIYFYRKPCMSCFCEIVLDIYPYPQNSM
jgi:hypothetical protein